MLPDDQLARMERLVQVLVRRKPIAAFLRVSPEVPTTLIGAPHTTAIAKPSTEQALPWQVGWDDGLTDHRDECPLYGQRAQRPRVGFLAS